jgi:hypothetical protein
MQKFNISLALKQFPTEMAQDCEAERLKINEKAGYTKYSKTTMEMHHRNAKHLLGGAAKTFRQAVADGCYTERTTLPKTRWFLPLLPEHRQKLINLLETKALTISKKGEMILTVQEISHVH